MLATPVKIMAASRVREATKPSAMPWFCRLTTGYSVMAVPMPARATMTSRKPPQSAAGVGAGADDEVRARYRAVELGRGASVGIETKVIR